MSQPIIRFEVEGMKHSLITALTENQAKMDEYVKEAVERATEPENIKRVVEKEVSRTLEKVIQDEVKNFFSYSGEGRQIIAKLVKNKLLNKDTFTPLDDV